MDSMAKYIAIAIVLCFLIPVILRAVRSACKGAYGLANAASSLPKKIGACSCGEKTICTSHNDEGWAMVCQNFDCGKSTRRYKYLSQAKSAWEQIREVK